LETIDNWRPVKFKWNDLAKQLNPVKDDRINYGVIAQELEIYNPEFVHPMYGEYKGVDYQQMYMIAVAAIKELKQRIEVLEGRRRFRN